MTPGVLRLAPPGFARGRSTSGPLTGFERSYGRSVRRLTPTVPLRPPEPPNGPSRLEVWRTWEELDWFSCTYCDAALGEMVVGEVDHVIPVSRGGTHSLHNLTPACAECNRGKSDRSAQYWISVLAGQSSTQRGTNVTER